MKKFKQTLAVLTALLMLCFVLPVGVFAEEDIPIDEAHFPDPNFLHFVKFGHDEVTEVDFDADGDGVLSAEEIAAVKNINAGSSNIKNFTGIGYFTALEYFYCTGNDELTALDLSQNTELTHLECGNTDISALDVSMLTKLETLYCVPNRSLTELNVSGAAALETLWCYMTSLSVLDVSGAPALKELRCEEAQLTELNVSQNTALEYLQCNNNQLTTLDLSNAAALAHLDCSYNRLTSLNISGTALTEGEFYCYENQYQASANSFDLTTLPGNFDITKASEWQGGNVNGHWLTFTADKATYAYDCGSGLSATFALLSSGEAQEGIPGDYDCSGVVNVQDAILTLRAAMGLITPSAQSLLNADMNGDGKLAVTDAITILRMAMGLV